MFSDEQSFTSVTLIAIIFSFAGWIFYCQFLHPLRTIPGPILASFSQAWIVYHTVRGDLEKAQRKLHKKHGYLIRIAPDEIACSDPEGIKIIYGKKTVFSKAESYAAFTPPTDVQDVGYAGHFATRDEKAHSQRREIVEKVYSLPSILQYEPLIDSCTDMFCSTMKEFANEKSVVDLGLWINRYTFDVIGELFFGTAFGFMRLRKDVGLCMTAVDTLRSTFAVKSALPPSLTYFYKLLTIYFMDTVKGAMVAVSKIDAAAMTAVRRRTEAIEQKKDKRRDLLRKMLDISAKTKDEKAFTRDHISFETQNAVFDGGDPTAIAINSILYHLVRNPSTYERVTAEIDAANLSLPVAYDDASKLPYLKACINEAMRIHPSVGATLSRVVPEAGATVSGFYIPGGNRVGINAAVVQFDEKVFGEDSEAFNPDRWFSSDKGKVTKMEETMLQFGMGPRQCIGQHIALVEIYKFVPHVMKLFHIRLEEPVKSWTTKTSWFSKQSSINVYIEERSAGN
ncbi:cytochrome P450 [Calycina marina]|uniref:Cytochrome P450 n=1 Tax=Calycina marina TaxID=1763456 RepID=A0A9P7YVD6_9HELO|nr:cytochrome P450 [Calycina marina]